MSIEGSKMRKLAQTQKLKITAEMRRRNKPVSGALYRSIRSQLGRTGAMGHGDIVMVVSTHPYLTDRSYTTVVAGQQTVTVVQEWVDLVILWNEKTVDISGGREHLWYHWFERILYDEE